MIHINFYYKGTHIHCEAESSHMRPQVADAVKAVDDALEHLGAPAFEQPPVYGAVGVGSSDGRTAPTETAEPETAESKAKAKADADAQAEADAKKKADADAKAEKAADKKAADEKAAAKKAADEKAAAKKKADEDAAGKAAQEEQASENADASEKSEEKPEITLDTLRDQVMSYAKENGNVQGKRLVQEIGGAEKISGVPEDKWLELFKAAGGEV